jgi:hypothetical protein
MRAESRACASVHLFGVASTEPQASGGREVTATEDHFADWLGASPCRFARGFAKKDRITPLEVLEPVIPADAQRLNLFLDAAGAASQVALILWPLLRTYEEIVPLILALTSDARWRWSRVPWVNHVRDDATLIGLTWRTGGGEESSVMGFGPFGSMPVTRRGPYVALAVWPGGQENRKHQSAPGKVGFIDCKITSDVAADDDGYDTLWRSTRSEVTRLLSAPPPDHGKTLRDVAFCLPSAVAALLDANARE